MINLNSITEEKNRRTRYALPGGIMTDRAYYALDVLMEMRDLAERTIEAQKARRVVMKTKGGAVITRKKSGDSRCFLGV